MPPEPAFLAVMVAGFSRIELWVLKEDLNYLWLVVDAGQHQGCFPPVARVDINGGFFQESLDHGWLPEGAGDVQERLSRLIVMVVQVQLFALGKQGLDCGASNLT